MATVSYQSIACCDLIFTDVYLSLSLSLSLYLSISLFLITGDCQAIFRFGHYGRPPQLAIWFPQLLVWLIIVIASKLLLLVSVVHVMGVIDQFVDVVFAPLRAHPKFELVVVMVFFPAVMNIVQFWITDTFIKDRNNTNNTHSSHARGSHTHTHAHMPLPTIDLDEDMLLSSSSGGEEEKYEEGSDMIKKKKKKILRDERGRGKMFSFDFTVSSIMILTILSLSLSLSFPRNRIKFSLIICKHPIHSANIRSKSSLSSRDS
jgi:hypothetical protein